MTKIILFHDPTGDYRFKGGPNRRPPPDAAEYPIPEHKSLFGENNQCGLPIGNLTSQFWANGYLSRTCDHFTRLRVCAAHDNFMVMNHFMVMNRFGSPRFLAIRWSNEDDRW